MYGETMGTKERREREKKDLRQKILDAALHIITDEGFAAMSMRKLAERIEYSPASIYLHFRNREQIAQELSEVGFAKLLTYLSEAVEGRETVEAFQAACRAYVNFGLENPETYRLIFLGDSAYVKAAFAEKKDDNAAGQAYQVLVDLAERLKREGFDGGDAGSIAVADTVWSALHGIVSLKVWCDGFPMTPAEELIRLTTQTLLQGLRTSTAVQTKTSPKKKAR
jgi:AcrR family transcriptional regulator